jgi:hypothetical protein
MCEVAKSIFTVSGDIRTCVFIDLVIPSCTPCDPSYQTWVGTVLPWIGTDGISGKITDNKARTGICEEVLIGSLSSMLIKMFKSWEPIINKSVTYQYPYDGGKCSWWDS